MLLTSTYTSNAPVDIPILIVCYGTRKVFMLKPQTYTELIAYVRQKFGISDACDLNVETVALDVCRGLKVEIDESAWSVMRASLDEVNVTVVVKGGEMELDGGVDMDVPMPVESLVKEEEQQQELPVAEYQEPEVIEEWTGMDGQDDENQIGKDRPTSVCSMKAKESEEEEEENTFVHSESEDGPQDKTGAAVSEDEEVQGMEETPMRRRRMISRRIFARVESEERQPTPITVRFVEPEEHKRVTRVPSPEARFQVRVEGPEPDQHAEIKTRGKHLVKKVLAAVCKTFNLDYESAALYIVTVSISAEGAFQEHCTRCPPDWSMTKCGVTSGTNLRIRIEASGASTIAVMQRSK